jgi:aminomethyltransferase
MSGKILKKILLNPESVFMEMDYFSFKGHYLPYASPPAKAQLKDGTTIMVSRTGYTGEFGFEIFMDLMQLVKIWKLLLENGEEFGLIPCGLAARDFLRAGALLPLAHQDIGDWPFVNHPCRLIPMEPVLQSSLSLLETS